MEADVQNSTTKRWLISFAVVLLSVAAATALRVALAPLVGEAIPFVTYFAAAILLAWYDGFVSSALCIVLSAFAGSYYVLNAGWVAWDGSLTDRAAMIGFMVAAFVVSFLIAFQRRTLARALEAEHEQAALAQENARLLRDSQKFAAELVKSNEDLRRANQDLELFAYSASHDLREPLRTISISSELMQEACGPDTPSEARRCLTQINASARRMNNLLYDLLSYARAAKDKDLPVDPVDSNIVVRDVLKNLSGSIEQAGASITIGELPQVRFPESRLEQVFQNLIGNAIKYRGTDPPRVHVDSQERNGAWVFSVRDNGIGFDPQYSEYVFGLFKRLHPQGDFPGTGVGLALCRRVLEHYGGRIWVERTAPGQGSMFCFSIPASTSALHETAGRVAVGRAV